MEDYIFVAPWALVFAVLMVVLPYLLLFALTNVVYRLVSGRFFRWVSWRTLVPFLLVLLGGWGFIIHALTRPHAFVITH